ncbi:MAG: asparagine synthase (glutamine-hydrolyzing) [bacterium]
MCGICGFLNYNLPAGETGRIIHRMCQSMEHRGPDDKGTYTDSKVALGMRRLSIIDLCTGHQPISNEHQTMWVVANGEIYNFRELRDELQERGHRFKTGSDSEVLVHLYEDEGVHCLDRLNGMFAFAIWDTLTQKLFLARDRIGIKPLHFASMNQTFIFASEIKAILQYPGFYRAINPKAVNLYLTYEYIPSPETIFQSIQKLPPGHFLVVNNQGEVHHQQYWNFEYRSKINLSGEDEYQEMLLEKLTRSVQRRLISDVPLGSFLSGGIDSSMIVSLMKKLDQGRVDSFHIGFREKSFDESIFAHTVADHVKINHRHHQFDTSTLLDILPRVAENLDEPLGDASILPTYLLCQFCRRYVTVALSGDGGDELFAGYYTYQAHRLAKVYTLFPRLLRQGIIEKVVRRLPVSPENFSFDFRAKKFISGINYPAGIRNYVWMGSFTPEEKKSLLQPDFRQAIQHHDEFSIIHDFLRSAPVENWLDAILYLDMKLYLQEDLLLKVDRASMANALEVRVPFLDHEFVDFATRLPHHLKLRRFQTKYILKRSARRFLPQSIIHRSKKGFGIPLAQWIHTDLRSLLAATFARDSIEAQGIFNPGFIHQLLQDHWEGRADNRKQLWTLFMFQMWFQKVFQKTSSTD